jgi:hypothetical protein
MTVVAVAPFLLRDVILTLGTDSYQAHVSQVEFVPTSSPVVWKGLTPSSVHTLGTTATWVCNLAFAQDFETVDSLSLYLHANEGDEVVGIFEPIAGGATVTANLILTPGGIGGTVDGVAVASVSLGVSGKPTITPGV